MEDSKKGSAIVWKYILGLVLILALAAVAVISLIREKIVNPNFNQLSVTAQGLVVVQPDLAEMVVAVKSDKVGLAAVGVKENTDRMNKVVAEMKKLGVAEKDLSTTNYTMYPSYEYPGGSGERVLAGYDVYQELTVKIRDLSKVGSLISAATGAGANQINSVVFKLENEESAKQLARQDAINKAKTKAEELARMTGIKIGKLINVYENAVYFPDGKGYSYGEGMGGAVTGSNIQPGENEVRLEVILTYKVK